MRFPVIGRRLLLRAATLCPSIAMAAATAPARAAAPADTLTVIAEIVAKPGSADTVRAVLEDLAAASRHEPGCRLYTLLEDRKTAGRFLTHEIWDSATDLAAHMHTPAMQQAGPKVQGLLAAVPTQAILKTIST